MSTDTRATTDTPTTTTTTSTGTTTHTLSLPSVYSSSSICLSHKVIIADEKIFSEFRYLVLHCLLPQPKNTGYKLRQHTHDLTLPTDINAVIKQNFVYRMLFRAIY